MNKKIKELAGTALDTSVPHTWTTLTAYDLDRFTEKFAELIVKETLQVAKAGIEFGPSMEEAVYTYFGVEE